MTISKELDLSNRKFSAKSYVQEGLIALWDSIENVAFGKHDNSAVKWRNLVQIPNDSDLNVGPDVVWHDNFLQLPPMGKNGAQTSFAGSVWQKQFLDAIRNKTYTYQTVVGLDKLEPNPYKTDVYGMMRPGISPCANYFQLGTTGNYSNVFCLNMSTDGQGSWWAYSVYDKDVSVLGNYCLTVAISPYLISDRAKVEFWKNSMKLKTQSACYPGPTHQFIDDNDRAKFENQAKQPWSVGTYSCYASMDRQYCFRLYNRTLSDDEIMHNAEIDKERFGIC